MNNSKNRSVLRLALLAAGLMMTFLSFPARAVDLAYLLGNAALGLDPKNYAPALKKLDAQIQQSPTNLIARELRIRILLQEGKYDEVITDCNVLIKSSTNSPSLAGYAFRGCAYFGKTNYAQAITDLTLCINAKPTALSYVIRGAAYENSGNIDRAINDYSSAILFEPTNPLTFFLRANCYFEKKDFGSALSDASQAIELHPFDPEAYAGRGFMNFSKGDYANATADYTKALMQDKKCILAYNNLAWLLAVCPDVKYRDGARAVMNATRACELTGWKVPFCLGTLAAAYAESGDFAAAVKWQEESIKCGLPDNDLKQAKVWLELYKNHKPYRVEEPK